MELMECAPKWNNYEVKSLYLLGCTVKRSLEKQKDVIITKVTFPRFGILIDWACEKIYIER